MYLSFGVLDVWVVPEHKEFVWIIRAVALSVFLACFLFTYSQLFKKYNQLSQMLVAFVGGVGVVAMVAVIPLEAGYYYYVGIILAVVFYYVIIGLSFINALYINLIILVAYECVAIIRDLPVHMLVNNNYFLVGVSVVAGAVFYRAAAADKF